MSDKEAEKPVSEPPTVVVSENPDKTDLILQSLIDMKAEIDNLKRKHEDAFENQPSNSSQDIHNDNSLNQIDFSFLNNNSETHENKTKSKLAETPFSNLRLHNKSNRIVKIKSKQSSETPVREKRKTPVRSIVECPVRQTETDQSDHEGDDLFNPYASQTDGYDSSEDLVDSNQFDISKITSVATDEDKTDPINQELAEILLQNWGSKKPLENMKTIFKKYPCPKNCTTDPAKVNPELWKLLNSNQRKADVKLVGVQKSLKKALNIGLSVIEEVQKKNVSLQNIAQKTVDMAAILGHASHEISLKRRIFIRSVIKPEYKDLCATTQPITEFLFGDDLPKLVKGLNLTNKLGTKYSTHKNNSYDKSQSRYRPYKRNANFLGRGRGNLPYKSSNNHQSNHYNRQYKK